MHFDEKTTSGIGRKTLNGNGDFSHGLPMDPRKSVVTLRYFSRDLQMGVSENSVPLNPMVNDHYPY